MTDMRRRQFLELVGSATLATSCVRARIAGPPAGESRVRAIAFDLLTIFDPRDVDARVTAVLPDADARFAMTWKTRLFDYCWIRASAGQYASFDRLVLDALDATARTYGVELDRSTRDTLAAAFTELEPWPDAATVLHALAARKLRLAPLANFAPRMIEALLDRAGLRDAFERVLSTDLARTYKPDPRAYALAESAFALPRSEIAFAAFAGWDAAGARWYGYPTFWVNRAGSREESLARADATGPDLHALAAWPALA